MFGRSTPASEASSPVVVAQHAALSRDAARDVRMQGDQRLALGAAPHDEKAAVLESAARPARSCWSAPPGNRDNARKSGASESNSDCGIQRGLPRRRPSTKNMYMVTSNSAGSVISP